MKTILLSIALAFVFTSHLPAQNNTVQKVKFKAFGNCDLCKTRIEKALKIKEVKSAT